MNRSKYWETKELHDFLLSRARAPFIYGQNDCCLFAADAVKAMTGVDIAAEFRGYKTEAGALKAIRKITGGRSVADALTYVAEKFGMPERPKLFAQRGDLVLVKEDGREIAGIVHLDGRYVVVPGETGLRRKPLADVVRVWRV